NGTKSLDSITPLKKV
ncbi:lipocalin family protein, partial [Vibrio cholerae O1 str. EM-1536]